MITPARTLLVASLFSVACSSENKVTREVPYKGDAWVEPRPVYDVPAASLALITNNASDTISIFDLAKNSVVATVPIDVDPLANDGPHHAVLDPKGAFVYVPLAYPPPTFAVGPHGQHGASSLPGLLLKLRSSDLGVVAVRSVDNNPGDITITPDGTKLVVTHFDLNRAIEGLKRKLPLEDLRAPAMIIAAETLEVLSSPRVCIAAHGVVMRGDGKRAYLACYGEDAIGSLSFDDPKAPVVELWPLEGALGTPATLQYGPYFVVLSPDEKTLVVTETEGKEIRFVDIATKKTTARIDTRGAAFGPASSPTGATWIVPTQSPDQLMIVDTATATATKTRPLSKDECEKPHQVARRGERWFVVCEGDHVKSGKILEIDPVSLATLKTHEVGAYPDVITFVGSSP